VVRYASPEPVRTNDIAQEGAGTMRVPDSSGITRRAAKTLAAVGAVMAVLLGMTVFALPASAATNQPTYNARIILSGKSLHHWYTRAGSPAWHSEPLADPDDITRIGGYLFTGFQNEVGPQGQASADGNRDSTIVEFTLTGQVIAQWDVRGKCDGLTANPATGLVVATVNEDAHSSLYTINPFTGQVVHYFYNRPLPHNGGTDAISFYRGMMLISASAPGTTGAAAPQPGYPAVYSVTLLPAVRVAVVLPLFYDESPATAANGPHLGQTVGLALTDPDSNEVVPYTAPRFRGDFMLTSQGDKEQIYVSGAGAGDQHLSVLALSQSVDDTAWATTRYGALYAADTSGDTIDMIWGFFWPGTAFVAVTPCGANNAPATCPAPGFPPNYLGQLNMYTGQINPVSVRGPSVEPQGMIFVPF
jgi:hypothetical protein